MYILVLLLLLLCTVTPFVARSPLAWGGHEEVERDKVEIWPLKSEDDIISLFLVIDVNKNGFFDFDEFSDSFSHLGLQSLSKRMDDMVEKSDENGDMQIGFDEFVHYMNIPHRPRGVRSSRFAIVVNIKVLAGGMFSFVADLHGTVLDVKFEIQRLKAIPVKMQTIVFVGEVLEDHYSLLQYNVRPQSVLFLVGGLTPSIIILPPS
jgi:hypothetical protein